MKKLIILFILLFASTVWGFDIERSHWDGENIYDDTIDDDSIDFADVTCADLTTTDCGAITTTGLTITTTNAFNLGANRIDNTANLLDGEMIGDDTIDDDSIDFVDVTCVDITMSDCGAITSSGLFTNSSSAITCATNVCTDVPAAYAVYITTQSDATPDVLAIADGTAGQEKLIVLKGAGTDDLTITPTNYGSGTSITCTTTGFSAKLHFDGTNWQVVSLFGCTDD